METMVLGDTVTSSVSGFSTHLFSLVTDSGQHQFVISTENDVTSDVTITTTTEKPYEEFTEVKAAILIDRIYIPLVVAVGVLGNVLCFVTLVFSSLRATSTCVYMAAIAVLDCVILVLDFCVLIRGYMGHTQFYMQNDWTCGFHNFLFYFAIHFDVLLLIAMTIDRFIVVRFPLKAPSICTPSSAVKAIILVGLFTFGLNFQIFFTRRLGATGSPEDPLKCWYPDPDVDFFMTKIYTWIDASIYSFIPCLSLLVLNVLIIRQLRVSMKFSRQFTERSGKSSALKGVPSLRVEVEGDTVNSGVYTSHTDVSCSEVSMGSCDTMEDNLDSPSPRPISAISGKKSNGSSSHSRTSSTKKAITNTNITVMLLMVSFTFLLLTSPVVIVLLYKRYYWLPDTNAERARARLTHAFVDNLMYTNHAVNFVLYCVSGRRFREELKRLLSGACCRR
ncbi:G-protein coupled receptor 84-like isoform X2 [Littorina saxatilis]|uniref:G-protein coupled receptors family 1 profile domain-containing protein n=2 Tax=Littorina saxatilis TaxID=31220 RepID=A0AAN9BSX4_9CAEN